MWSGSRASPVSPRMVHIWVTSSEGRPSAHVRVTQGGAVRVWLFWLLAPGHLSGIWHSDWPSAPGCRLRPLRLRLRTRSP